MSNAEAKRPKVHRPASAEEKKRSGVCHYCARVMTKHAGRPRHCDSTKQHILPKREKGVGRQHLGAIKGQSVIMLRPACYGCNQTLQLAMECPGMMMCAFMVAEDLVRRGGTMYRHDGARSVLKAWGVITMKRPGRYNGFSLNRMMERAEA